MTVTRRGSSAASLERPVAAAMSMPITETCIARLERADPAPAARRLRRIAILTPVLDDWACLAELLEEIAAEYGDAGVRFEVLAVDDGSAEPFDPDTLSLPADGCITRVQLLRLALNLGHQRAIAVGLCAVADRDDLDAVVVMDSDGEDRPADIGALLAAGENQRDRVILASRTQRCESLLFRVCYRAYKAAFRALTGQPISFGNFSLLPMTAVRRLVHMPELWNNLAACVMRSRLKFVTVPIARGRRYHGASRMKLVGLIVHGLSALSVHTDTIFVRVLLGCGLVCTASLIGIVGVVVTRFATDFAIPGWASTMVGDLSIILLQTIVLVVAASLMMLAGRSARPIIPIADAGQFVARDRCKTAAAAGGLSALSHEPV